MAIIEPILFLLVGFILGVIVTTAIVITLVFREN